MNKEKLLIEVNNLLEGKHAVTSEVKNALYNLGFQLRDFGSKKENEIHSREIRIDFNGYDIAVGLASMSAGGNFRRKYFALVYKFQENK